MHAMKRTGHRQSVWRTLLVGLVVLAATSARGEDEVRGTFRFGGTARDMAWAAAGTSDGGLFVVGSFIGKTDFDPSTAAKSAEALKAAEPPPAQRLDAFLASYDAKGRFVWAVTMGGSGTNLALSVAVGGDGVVCVAGNFEGKVDFDRRDPPDEEDTLETRSGRDAFVACYDLDGEFLWVRGFGDEDKRRKGDRRRAVEFSESIRGVAIDADANVYAIGMFSGTLDLEPGDDLVERTSTSGSRDVFVVSLDPRGAYRWGFTLGGTGMDQGQAIALRPGGGFVIGGCFSVAVDFDPGKEVDFGVAAGRQDAFVAWYDKDRAFERQVTFGAEGIDQVMDGCLAVDDSDATYVAGEISGLVDVDPGRKMLALDCRGKSDAFVVRYKKNGRPDWAFSLGGSGADSVHALCLRPKGGVALTGRFQGKVDFDPGRRKTLLDAPGTAGATAAYVAAFDAKKKLRWARALGTDADGARKLTRGAGVIQRGDGGLTAVGTFYGSIDVDPTSEKRMLSNLGDADVYVVRYDAKGNPLR